MFCAAIVTCVVWAAFHRPLASATGEHPLRDLGFLLMGSVMFTATAPFLLGYSRLIDPTHLGCVVVFGLSFPIWGFACGILGIVGSIPMALVTGWVLWSITRSWLLACAPAVALVPALSIAGITDHELFIFPDLFNAVGIWNVTMGCTLAAWAYVERNRSPRHTPSCASCRYELTGLDSPVCPECGEPVPARACPRCQRDLRGPDSRGLRLRKCPDCGRPVR